MILYTLGAQVKQKDKFASLNIQRSGPSKTVHPYNRQKPFSLPGQIMQFYILPRICEEMWLYHERIGIPFILGLTKHKYKSMQQHAPPKQAS